MVKFIARLCENPRVASCESTSPRFLFLHDPVRLPESRRDLIELGVMAGVAHRLARRGELNLARTI
jgi:hypothetical protein